MTLTVNKPLIATTTTTTPITPAVTTTVSPVEVAKPRPIDGVDKPVVTTTVDKPLGANHPVSLVSEADLKTAIDTSSALSSTSNPAIAGVFNAAGEAAARVQKATSIDIPLRLAVTTGFGNGQGPRLPQDLPGMLKERGTPSGGSVVTFYPADEALKPFDVDSALAKNLPKNTILVARTLKKTMDFSLPDGSVEKAAVYRVGNNGLAPPRPNFVGVVDFIAGDPYVRDLVPPPRMVALPALNAGKPWREGSIVDVAVTTDANGKPNEAKVNKELAAGGSPLARTWMIASAQKLDAVFPKGCVAEAAAIEKASSSSLADKSLVDLTKTPFFAIDNDASRDIDQCMHLEKRADGGYVLSYALADAAHYIKPGSGLFEEGMQRGASYYLPGLSIPMLPDNLSSGVISLNAHEDHRALVLQIRLDKNGNVEGDTTVLRAKIHSQAQITYNGVSAELEGKGPIKQDIHGKAVPKEVSAQLKIFQEIGALRIAKAKERGVVEPDRREMEIGSDGSKFFLKPEKSDLASKLNAELSILANVGGAQQLLGSKIPGVDVPGLFKVHDEPAPQAMQALGRMVSVIVDKNGLPPAFKWDTKKETLSAWVDRIKLLPKSPREESLSQVLQLAAVRINVSSEFSDEPGRHSGLKVEHYGRFSAPMREQVGVVSHAILFAKAALEKAFDLSSLGAGKLSPQEAVALWAPLLLGAVVDPSKIPPGRQDLAQKAQALLTSTGPELASLAKQLAAEALKQGPSLSVDEQKLVDDVTRRASQAGNTSKMKQGQVEGAALRLLFDDLFAKDLGSNPLGDPNAPKRSGTITSVTPGKVYIQLTDPDVEVRLAVDDLKRHCPTATFHLEDEGCALVGDQGGAVGRLLIGQEIKVQATHHDGERLHFAIVS
ncbi:MAG: ribonuclease catalytic domain-containing protein [Deltaproteobacteria bacterium]|nr:ribonuclease catalytic domain-containing protein [Deltaproteobacteria bacterium]